MLIELHPNNLDERKLKQITDCLAAGGVIIYPTDAVYSIGCDLNNSKAIEKVARLKGIPAEKANFSLVCEDLSHLSEFCKPINNTVYKLMKRALPGPYTFILDANTQVPKIFKSKKKTIGIRVPDHIVPREIVRLLGRPIIATSVHDDDDVIEYTTDPELIHERYKDKVDIVVSCGIGNIEASTIIDCTGGEPEVIRLGRGPIEGLM